MRSLLRLIITSWIIGTASGGFNLWDAVAASTSAPSASKIIIAVIDTGIDPKHTQLTQAIWHDPQSPQNVYGWNFVTNQPNPQDENGHGTHIAGIIRSVLRGSNLPEISIMPIKYYSSGGSGSINISLSVKAITYAIEHGARIINYSGGGPGYSEEEFLALKKAQDRGILLVAAAGNDQQNTDQKENYYYPSAYRTHGLTNIITVAAINQQNKLLSSSNWGQKTVDVAAPGERVYSTLPNNRFGYMSGTSQATAFVTGVAAAILKRNPLLSPQALREIIMRSVDTSPSLVGKIGSGGKVNLEKAILKVVVHPTLATLPISQLFAQH